MLIEKASYEITTLCKDDDEAVKKTNDHFNVIQYRVFDENPELMTCVDVIPTNVHFTERNVGNKTIRLRRIIWTIYGKDGGAEKFIECWKVIDKNPYRMFMVKPTYSLGQLSYLMNIREKE